MGFAYLLLAYLLVPVYAASMLWRGLRERGYWHGFAERLGGGPAIEGEASIWIHAVSVGEVQAAAPLVRALRANSAGMPLVLTTVTAAGAERARTLFSDGVLVRYLPLDLPGSVRRFLNRTRPRVAIVLEAEIWPTLFRAVRAREIPLVLASARISPRSASRYARFPGLLRDTLERGVVVCAQTAADAERFHRLGVTRDHIRVVGNIKFEFALPPDIAAQGERIRGAVAPGRPVWVAGSTHGGEEEIVVAAHRALRRRIPSALLVLAPRHRGRFADVAAALRRAGVQFVVRSGGAACRAETEVLLLDTLGELLAFYAASDVAFVGGSLVPVGGHNLLEPAALGLPIVTGPHHANSADIARQFEDGGAARLVTDADGLTAVVEELLRDPAERARMGALGREIVERNRGALARLLEVAEPLISRGSAS